MCIRICTCTYIYIYICICIATLLGGRQLVGRSGDVGAHGVDAVAEPL